MRLSTLFLSLRLVIFLASTTTFFWMAELPKAHANPFFEAPPRYCTFIMTLLDGQKAFRSVKILGERELGAKCSVGGWVGNVTYTNIRKDLTLNCRVERRRGEFQIVKTDTPVGLGQPCLVGDKNYPLRGYGSHEPTLYDHDTGELPTAHFRSKRHLIR